MKPLAVLAYVSVALFPLGAFAQPPAVQAGGRATKNLYAILVVDTDADKGKGDLGIGASVEKDRENLITVLKNAFHKDNNMPGRLFLEVFDGNRACAKKVREYISDLKGKVQPTDTFLFYYCGHGGESKNGNQRFAFYHDGKKTPFRYEFEDEINRLNPRLKIILYDCCSTRAEPRRLGKLPDTARVRGPNGQVNAKLFQQLFFEGSDWVIIAAATSGKPSAGNEDLGGFFTASFVDFLDKEIKDFNPTGRVTWKDFFDKVQQRTNRLNPDQRPQAHFLNECRDREYQVKFTNNRNEDVAVQFRYLRGDELDQVLTGQVTKGWTELTVPARTALFAKDGKVPLRAASYQFVAIGQKSKKKWALSSNSDAADQKSTFPLTINMGIPYNASKTGGIVTKEHVFESD